MLFPTYFITSALVAFTLATEITLQTSTSTVLKCSTAYGGKSVAPPLQTSTATKTIRFLPNFGASVSTPIVTETPPPVTVTSTAQVTVTVTTTNNAITDTFSTTSTILTTNTITQGSQSTITKTESFSDTISTTTVSLVPTSPGFLPIESTTATAYPNTPARRFMQFNKRAGSKKGGICGSSYPQRVYCVQSVQIFSTVILIKTAPTKTTTLAPITSTETTTITGTSTSTVAPPNVSTTLSFTVTSGVDTTVTNTDTVTTTISTTSTLTITSTSTLYAACTPSSQNILGPQTPNGLIEAITGSNSFVISNPGSPYGCCVDCQLSNTCAGTFYSVGSQDQQGQCIQVQSSQCSSQSAFSRAYLTNPQDNGFTYISSNGNCGYLYYGGQFN